MKRVILFPRLVTHHLLVLGSIFFICLFHKTFAPYESFRRKPKLRPCLEKLKNSVKYLCCCCCYRVPKLVPLDHAAGENFHNPTDLSRLYIREECLKLKSYK